MAGAAPVLVLGYAIWRARFGGDPHVLGRRLLSYENADHTVRLDAERDLPALDDLGFRLIKAVGRCSLVLAEPTDSWRSMSR